MKVLSNYFLNIFFSLSYSCSSRTLIKYIFVCLMLSHHVLEIFFILCFQITFSIDLSSSLLIIFMTAQIYCCSILLSFLSYLLYVLTPEFLFVFFFYNFYLFIDTLIVTFNYLSMDTFCFLNIYNSYFEDFLC